MLRSGYKHSSYTYEKIWTKIFDEMHCILTMRATLVTSPPHDSGVLLQYHCKAAWYQWALHGE